MADSALPANRQMLGLKDLPMVRQLALLVGLALAVAGGVALFTWSQQPNYVPVYPGLAEKDSAEVAEALRAAGTPFHLDPSTGTVTVPGDKVYEARMHLASQGLPKGTAAGFEMIQQDQGLGTSQFIESARYQLALETELARTISSLQPVKSARVHLALPKASAFVHRQDNASASVVVDLHPGRQLDQGQVSAIVHIVSSSVPDLTPGGVSVIDQYGHLLTQSDPDSDVAQSAAQFEQTHHLESDYVRRIEQLLTPMLGTGRVSAQVAADMDFSVTEEAHETFKPDAAAVRSEQTSEDVTRSGGAAAQGIPGATSNQPPAAVSAARPAAAANAAGTTPPPAAPAQNTSGSSDTTVSQSHTSTRNYELDRTVSHTRMPVGRVRRLSVAVLVDYVQKADAKSGKKSQVALSQEELTKVEALVKEAVGFDAARGDSVAVQNAPFAATEVVPALAPQPLWQRPEVRDIARQVLGVVVLLVLMFAVLRPTLRKLLTTPSLPPGVGMALEAQPGQGAPGGGGPPAIAYEQKLTAARGAVAQDPKRVAQVVKTWLGEDG